MKIEVCKSLFSVAVVLFLVIGLTSFTIDGPGRWEKLGERKVDRAMDHDKILVGAGEGTFTKLKIIVRHSGLNLHKMVVHYGNGEDQELAVREDIPRGGESRVIDLSGNKRVIRSVDFWYDTKGLLNDKTVVELWGRH